MFDPEFTRSECVRLIKDTPHEKFKHQLSRWDSQGGFVAGAEYQYNKMIEENNRLRMLIADVLYGWIPEEAGPEFDWIGWTELAIKEVGPKEEEHGVSKNVLFNAWQNVLSDYGNKLKNPHEEHNIFMAKLWATNIFEALKKEGYEVIIKKDNLEIYRS